MATLRRRTLLLCVLLMVSQGWSLPGAARSEHKGQKTEMSGDHGMTSSSPHTETGDVTGSGHDVTGDSHGEGGGHGGGPTTTLPIVSLKWNHVSVPYLVALWILVCAICELIITANHHVPNVIPESALLICFGYILGGMILGVDKVQTFKLTPRVFFFYLLPPIILDAGYFMPNKLFFSNIGTIFVYAIIGTCWNAASVGLSLWGCHMGGAIGDLDIGLLQYLLFGSLIAAVDPVAVLAVFEQVHVNEVLFILVFGESLLNDGVTVALFNVFDSFASLGGSQIDALEIIKGIISFFVVAFGGSLLGLAFGLLLSLLTRCTKNIQIIEATFIFVLGYLSYLTAEMLSLSAILAIVFCGMSCQKYMNANMDERSVTTVRSVMKALAKMSETIIFVFLGISAVDKTLWVWNTGFVLLTLLFIFVYRFIGVFFLTWIMNKFRLVPLEVIDQMIMNYSGLRGPVAYGLAMMLDENKIKEKNLMVSTTLIVIYFTVILQGVTMKPLVTWIKVKRAAVCDITLVEKVQNKVFDHMVVATGQTGHNSMRDKWSHFEEKWMSRIFMKPSARKNRDSGFKVDHKLNLKDAMSDVAEGVTMKPLVTWIKVKRAAVCDITLVEKVQNKVFDHMVVATGQTGHNSMRDKWSHFEEKWMSRIFMKPSARKNRDSGFKVDHKLNLKDAMSDVAEGERRGSLEFIQDESAFVDFKKRYGEKFSPDIMANMADDWGTVSPMGRDPVPSVSLEMHEQTIQGVREAEDINSHHRLQQHFYKGRKQHRHRYSRSHFEVNKDESEVQEIFQRTVRRRRKRIMRRRRNFEFSEGDGTSGYQASGDSLAMRVTHGVGACIENPAFVTELDTMAPMQIPPWLAEAELDSGMVAPSHRAQMRLPWTPSNLRRLAPLRTSTRSTDSSMQADEPATQERDEDEFPPTGDAI